MLLISNSLKPVVRPSARLSVSLAESPLGSKGASVAAECVSPPQELERRPRRRAEFLVINIVDIINIINIDIIMLEALQLYIGPVV